MDCTPNSARKRGSKASGRSSVSSGVDRTIKLAVMGASKVGKTALVSQFLWRVFVEQHVPTVEEANWIEYELVPAEGDTPAQMLTLQVIDTAGSDDFPSMRELYVSSCDAFILVFSVDDQVSWEVLTQMHDRILQLNTRRAPVLIIGNKIDMFDDDEQDQWSVKETVVSHFAASRRLPYTMLTAHDLGTVNAAFHQVLSKEVEFGACQRRRLSVPSSDAVRRGSSAFDPKDFKKIQAAAEKQQKQSQDKRKCALS